MNIYGAAEALSPGGIALTVPLVSYIIINDQLHISGAIQTVLPRH